MILVAWWIVIGTLLCGVGALAVRAAGVAVDRWDLGHFWIGLATVLAALQAWHLVRPIDGLALMAAAVAGAAGLLVGPRRLPAVDAPRWRIAAAVLAIGLLAVYLARHALVLPRAYDTGTYHLPQVNWFNAYPLVPGLANLHVRLGFNGSIVLYDALINAGPLRGMVVHLGLGLFALATGGELIATAFRVDPATPRPIAVACAIAIPLFLAITFSSAFEGLSPDLVLYCYGLHVGVLMLRALAVQHHPQQAAFARMSLVWLCLVGCTIKVSFAFFAAFVIVWTIRATAGAESRRSRIVMAAGSTITLVLWVVRGVVLSGYPLFPSPALPLPLPWRVPRETAAQLAGWIRAWPRQVNDRSMDVPYERILSGSEWLRPWLAHTAMDLWTVTIPLAIAGACAAGCALAGARRRVPRKHAAAVAGALLAIAAWFVTAPDVRFAGSLFVLLAMFAAATLLEMLNATPLDASRAARTLIVLAALAGVKQVHTMVKWWRVWPPAVSVRDLPAPQLRTFETAAGLRLLVPRGTETCWNAPLPCTPYPSARLALRRPGDLSSGFQVVPFSDDALVGWWSVAHPWDTRP